MSIPYRVQDYIAEHEVLWDPVTHPACGSCMEAAQRAHVPPGRLAKAVVLENAHGGYLMAVIPADRRLDVAELGEALGDEVSLAPERDLARLFPDCDRGAVPAVGPAYGLETFWDEDLGAQRDVFFEAGDHRTLVHVNGPEFVALMRGAHRLPAVLH